MKSNMPIGFRFFLFLRFIVCCFIVAVYVCTPLIAQEQNHIDHIVIAKPDLYGVSASDAQNLNSLLIRASEEAAELFEGLFFVSYNADRPGAAVPPERKTGVPAVKIKNTYTLNIMGIASQSPKLLYLTLRRDSDKAESEPATLFGVWDEHRSREIAHTIRYAHQSFSGFDQPLPFKPPLFFDELVGTMISAADLGYPAGLFPLSIDIGPKGNIFIGTSLVAFELDPLYREVGKPGRDLYTSQRIPYANSVRVTEAGTLFAGGVGEDLFVIRPGFPRHQRMRISITNPLSTAALSDGSYVAVATQKAIRVKDREVMELDIFPHEHSYAYPAAAGPEATLWTWDMLPGMVHVHTAEGVRVDSIVPLMDREGRQSVRALSALPDGGFMLLTMKNMYRFDRLGKPLWKLEGDFTMATSIVADPERGYIYLLNTITQKVSRFIDPTMAAELSDFDRQVLEINKHIAADPNAIDAYHRLVRLYEEHEAPALALEVRRKMLDLYPHDNEIVKAFEYSEALFFADHARQAGERALEVLNTIGIESARPLYTVTVQLYEQALARLAHALDDRNMIIREIETLRRAFDEYDAPRIRPPVINIAGLTDLFPALIQYYRNNAVAEVSVFNDQDEALENVVLSTSLRYSDFPVESELIPIIGPGESVKIPVYLILSPEVLLLQEDMPVLVELSLRYLRAGREETAVMTHTTMMRRNTALLWDDSAKLASFITPNDEIVQDFALTVIREAPSISNRLLSAKTIQAALVADAVGEHGILYVEDPNAPFTEVFGSESVLDTVRFPRTTLRLRTGDCDETSSLLASLYEAVGIHTAIMTSPGHVFIAFNTEEPAENRWLYESSDYLVLSHKGTLWIPVETTVLDRSFPVAWREASRLVRNHRETIEFLPLSEQRSLYPPIPLAPPSFTIVAPNSYNVSRTYTQSINTLENYMYHSKVPVLKDQIKDAGATGRSFIQLINQKGVLHARYGNFDAAEQTFLSAIEQEPRYFPAQINLANLYHLHGKYALALKQAEEVLETRPRLSAAKIVIIQAAAALEKMEQAHEAWVSLNELAPEQGARFSYLFDEGAVDGTAGVRASEAAANNRVLFWEQ